jgi:hypothetical protein
LSKKLKNQPSKNSAFSKVERKPRQETTVKSQPKPEILPKNSYEPKTSHDPNTEELYEPNLIIQSSDLAAVNSAAVVNFKQFSTQLFSRFEQLGTKQSGGDLLKQDAQTKSADQKMNSEEFIDNEIYRFVLNGKQGVGAGLPPPGFETHHVAIVTKEALENEELAKKLETFQIETDTEMSMLNTDENTSGSLSDFNDDDDDDGEEKNNDQYEDRIMKTDATKKG